MSFFDFVDMIAPSIGQGPKKYNALSDFSIDVPEEKVIWDRFNPTGRAVIFIEDSDWVSTVVCFVPSIGA